MVIFFQKMFKEKKIFRNFTRKKPRFSRFFCKIFSKNFTMPTPPYQFQSSPIPLDFCRIGRGLVGDWWGIGGESVGDWWGIGGGLVGQNFDRVNIVDFACVVVGDAGVGVGVVVAGAVSVAAARTVAVVVVVVVVVVVAVGVVGVDVLAWLP